MNAASKPLTHERLVEVLSYDRETGIFRWLVRLGRRTKVGKIAGSSFGKSGYRIIWIDGWRYHAGRLAWFYESRRWPAVFLDHIDGDRDNNRISNLREATRSQNNANRKLSRLNKSGFKGVSRDKSTGRWRSQITSDGKRHWLGVFDSPDEAHRAYCAAAETLHGKFARPS